MIKVIPLSIMHCTRAKEVNLAKFPVQSRTVWFQEEFWEHVLGSLFLMEFLFVPFATDVGLAHHKSLDHVAGHVKKINGGRYTISVPVFSLWVFVPRF